MPIATVTLKSISPMSQSRYYVEPEKGKKETSADYEKRTWRERLHYNDEGYVYIPPMMFKNCLSAAAKYISKQIPGQGKATYTKHFEAGVLVTDPLVLSVKKDEVPGEWLFLNADGKRGGDVRVMKCMPFISEWEGEVTYTILDSTITEEVFREHLEAAGQFIGIGRFRPRKNGFYGRYEMTKLSWAL